MEKHTTVDYFIEYTEIPIFAQLIFNSDQYEDVEKFKFKELFLNKYLSNKKFRNKVQGCYIYFYNKELFAVVKTQDDIENKLPGINLIGYEILDKEQKYYHM